MSAVDLKEQGNKLFSVRKYDDAISCYTKAIPMEISVIDFSGPIGASVLKFSVHLQVKNPGTATFFTNRALCYLRLKTWELAIQDCRRALELDRRLIKGHYFMGLALTELNHYEEAISSLNRAHELAKELKKNYGDDITSALRQAKRKRWNQIEEKRIQQEIELQTYINELIKEDAERRKNNLKIESGSTDSSEICDKKIEGIDGEKNKRLLEINEIFAQVDDRRQKRDVPDCLCGRISFELMREPVITPSGITYDKKDILEHLQRVGHFDPVTRTDLRENQLIPNLAMKEVIDNYLEENPWAEDF